MTLKHPRVILFIEPMKLPSEQPVTDRYSEMLSEVMGHVNVQINLARDTKTGEIKDKNKRWGVVRNHPTQPFVFHVMGRNRRRCICGAESQLFDIALLNYYYTNTLALHYLMWHREEVPVEELEKISRMYGNTRNSPIDVKIEVKDEPKNKSQ